jgi:hypothetical protein
MTEIERMSSSLKKELCRWKPEDEFSHGSEKCGTGLVI